MTPAARRILGFADLYGPGADLHGDGAYAAPLDAALAHERRTGGAAYDDPFAPGLAGSDVGLDDPLTALSAFSTDPVKEARRRAKRGGASPQTIGASPATGATTTASRPSPTPPATPPTQAQRRAAALATYGEMAGYEGPRVPGRSDIALVGPGMTREQLAEAVRAGQVLMAMPETTPFREQYITRDRSGEAQARQNLTTARLSAMDETIQRARQGASKANRRLLMNALGPSFFKAITGTSIDTGQAEAMRYAQEAEQRAQQIEQELGLRRPDIEQGAAVDAAVQREGDEYARQTGEQAAALGNWQREQAVQAQAAEVINQASRLGLQLDQTQQAALIEAMRVREAGASGLLRDGVEQAQLRQGDRRIGLDAQRLADDRAEAARRLSLDAARVRLAQNAQLWEQSAFVASNPQTVLAMRAMGAPISDAAVAAARQAAATSSGANIFNDSLGALLGAYDVASASGGELTPAQRGALNSTLSTMRVAASQRMAQLAERRGRLTPAEMAEYGRLQTATDVMKDVYAHDAKGVDAMGSLVDLVRDLYTPTGTPGTSRTAPGAPPSVRDVVERARTGGSLIDRFFERPR